MIILFLLLFAILLLSDFIIFKRHIPKIRWVRILYIIQAIVLDFGPVLFLLYTMVISPESQTDATAVAMTWVMLIFIMNSLMKVIFALFSVIELGILKLSKRRFKPLIYVGGVLSCIIFFAMFYGSTIGRSNIRVENITIESAQLPQAFDGMLVAQFSDAHIGNLSKRNPLIKNVVETINDLNPDLVIQSGDLVNIHAGELSAERMAEFSKIKAPVYAVIGNHDLGFYISNDKISPKQSLVELVEKQEAIGWRLLWNEHEYIHRGNDSIAICGVNFPDDEKIGGIDIRFEGCNLRKAFDGVNDSVFSILISHTPSVFDSIPDLAKPNLTVSGHVHAMQMKINIGNWSWSPIKWKFPMWSGLWVDRGHYLYVNDGVGYTMYPMRFGTRPEITLYTLKSIKK